MADLSAAAALRELLAGNQRFAAGKAIHPGQSSQRRAEVAMGQQPFAVVAGCSDSRVPPEIIFDRGLGDLFVVRTAGHVLDNVDVGTIQFAVEHLQVPLILVLGHSSCGAVSAAVAGQHVPGPLADVVRPLRQSALVVQGEPGDWVTNAVKENVRRTVRQLQSAAPLFNLPSGAPKLEIAGAYYDLETGLLEMLVGAAHGA